MTAPNLVEWQKIAPNGFVYPWFTHPFLDELETWELSTRTVLEFGAGRSTAWWRSKAKWVDSIEVDEAWARHAEAECRGAGLDNGSIACANVSERAEDRDRFLAMIPAGRRYDIVVVDGSWRDECLRWALQHFAEAPGIVIADNWQQDFVWISPSAETLMQPWPIHRFFQPDHVNHEGRPWNTAYWRIDSVPAEAAPATPFVSVLLPSRSRPAHLTAAIDSLVDTATDPSSIEFLVRIDDDQTGLYERALRRDRVVTLVGPHGNGYDDLHLMYNQLAAAARGKWLLQFNDDMRMMTRAWDSALAELKTHPTVALVNPCNQFGQIAPIHPFILKAGIDEIGHLSLNPYCDAWIFAVYGEAGATIDLPGVQIEHLRDRMHDDVVESQRQGTGWSRFEIPEAQQQRAADAAVLKRMLGRG
jgi:hypothetical protein